MDYVLRTAWGILYVDDACMVSRSPQGLSMMMEGIVEICQAFAFTMLAKKRDRVHASTAQTRTMVLVEAAG